MTDLTVNVCIIKLYVLILILSSYIPARITATAKVTDVKNYLKLTEDEIDKVFSDNKAELALTEKQEIRWHKKCICLVSFDSVEVLNPALDFEKQANMDDWLIVDKVEDVLVGTSIPYNYENSKL